MNTHHAHRPPTRCARRAIACALSAAGLAVTAATPAHAVEATWSGFATIGYARSDSAYTSQGSIDNQGTFRRDSLLAGQLDLRVSPQWSATVQAQVVPSERSDTDWRGKAAWAFVAWRPDNDWLVRAGKARVPLYLYSESLDVGVATDMARLPFEMYSISPTNDFTGLFVTHSATVANQDLTLDAYGGSASATARGWTRDGVPPFVPAGPLFNTVDVKVLGLALTARGPSLTWRLGVDATRTRRQDGQPLPVTFARVDLAPGLGYWQVDDSLPGPGVVTTPRIRNLLLTAGLEWQIDADWRVASEFVRMKQHDTQLGSDSHAGYAALFRRFGAFTPYLSYARQRSSDGLLGWRVNLTGPGLPASVPGADQINALQRLAGESLYAFDQHSTALGLSYALSPTARLKAEWMKTHVGAASAHFDTPAGQPDARNLSVDTLTLNYSVAF